MADIGSRRLDLTTFITGPQIEAVFADFATFLKTRKKPTQPVETFTGKLPTAIDYVEQPIHTEDHATVMLRYSSGARGILSLGMGWQIPRIPGLGDVNWAQFISALYGAGYDYVISIEHEDRAFEKTEELVKRAFLLSCDALRPYIHWVGPTLAVAQGRCKTDPYKSITPPTMSKVIGDSGLRKSDLGGVGIGLADHPMETHQTISLFRLIVLYIPAAEFVKKIPLLTYD